MRLFLDESGECSFSVRSAYKHFVITILSIDESAINKIRNSLRRRFTKFIEKGWDRNREVKAFEIFKNRRFGENSVREVLDALTRIDTLAISYIVVNKEKIENKSFRNAPYGTGYNYFTGILLSELAGLAAAGVHGA